ncbi:MAG: glycosyltransferase [Bacilli bacterium]
MGNKIKVLQISKRYPPYIGGIETTCCDISSFLESTNKYDVEVIAFNSTKKDVKEIIDGVTVYRVGVQKIVASQPLAKNYGKILKKILVDFNPDIIHFHYPDPYAANYVLKYLKKLHYKGKFILHWHADIIKQKLLKQLFVKQNKDLLNRADIVIATSPSYLKDTDYLPYYKGNIEILPSCIGKERTILTEDIIKKSNEIKEEHKNKKICFFFGRHVEYKGLKYLIESNEYIDRDKVDIIIGGSGPLTDELKKQASKYNNIYFVGKLSEDDINSYLLACDIFTFPSITRNEAFGISLAEAMYFAKPTVTFTILGSGVNWVSINNETGLEAQNKNSKQYGEYIMKLVNDEELYNKLSKGAKERSEKLFSEKEFNENVISIYNKMNVVGDK